MATTYSDKKVEENVTWKQIEKAALTVQDMGRPQLPNHKPRLFERLMNKWGWHRYNLKDIRDDRCTVCNKDISEW